MNAERKIVLVTGSNGRIGTEVMRRLTGRFSDVVGLDRKSPSPPPPSCTQIPVEGTRRLLQGLREGFEVEQFIFSSTMLVHKPGDPGQFITAGASDPAYLRGTARRAPVFRLDLARPGFYSPQGRDRRYRARRGAPHAIALGSRDSHRRAGDPQLRRVAAYVPAADLRRVVGDAECSRVHRQGGRVGSGPHTRPGSVHQTVDDRPGQSRKNKSPGIDERSLFHPELIHSDLRRILRCHL